MGLLGEVHLRASGWLSMVIVSGSTLGLAAAIQPHPRSTVQFDAMPPPRHALPLSAPLSDTPVSDPAAAVRLRVYRAPLREVQASLTRQTVSRILAHAGLALSWADCTRGDRDCMPGTAPGTIVVRFFRGAKDTSAGSCAEASTRTALPGGYIIVDVSCVHALVNRLNFGVDAQDGSKRLNPGLVAGVVLVHELGHTFREPHTAAGVMRQLLTRVELRAAVEGSLFFTAEQAARIRAAAEILRRDRTIARSSEVLDDHQIFTRMVQSRVQHVTSVRGGGEERANVTEIVGNRRRSCRIEVEEP
jgi:hypothetical protein